MPSAEQRRLERLLSRQERSIRAAFRTFVEVVQSDRVMAEVADLLEARRVESALRLVDTYVAQFASTTISRVFGPAAEAGAEEAAGRLRAAVAIAFDPSHPRAAELMRANRLTFIRDFSQQQRRATTRALSRAMEQGLGAREAARAFRDSIGLTEFQEAAVENYERLLRAGSAEALDRALRDRRFDRTVARAGDEPLKARQIRTMVARYRARTLAMRAETIARTESVRITSVAQREGVAQALEDAGVVPQLVTRVWNSTEDERTRDSHVAMDGQEVGLDEPFVTGAGNRIMFPGDPSAPPGETINCRCVVTHRIKEAA